MIRKTLCACLLAITFASFRDPGAPETLLLKDVTLIDGTGAAPRTHTDILIRNGKIAAIGKSLPATGARVIALSGKTVMPALIAAHMHIGMLKGTTTVPENYTRENILRHLKRYQDYGVLNVLSLGTDRPPLYENHLYDSLKAGLLPGARLFSAGYGFGVPAGAPPLEFGMNQVFRPANDKMVAAEMDSLQKIHPVVIKVWLDDFGGKYPKMNSATYKAVIREAHRHGWRVAAHVYYLSDARKLVQDGIDILAHSIRDSVVDDQLVQEMKRRKVTYIPTLTVDEFAYAYGESPRWLNDPFFRVAAEPGVYEMVSSPEYQAGVRNAASYSRNRNAIETALKNVKKLHDAGVEIAMGTDSGATPVRVQGFSEHLEMQLLEKAGIPGKDVIQIATQKAAKVLGIADRTGTVQTGKQADLLVLDGNPLDDITNTRRIEAVYKGGKQVNIQ